MKLNSLYLFLSKLQSVVPLIISLMALMFVHRIWGNSYSVLYIDRSGLLSISTILIVSGLVSLLPQRIQYTFQWVLIGCAYILDVVEIFLATHFNLNISPFIFQLLVETNSKETTEFIQTYVFSSKTLSVLIGYLMVLLFVLFVYKIDKRYRSQLFSVCCNKWVCLLWGTALFISCGWQFYMIPYYAGLSRFLTADSYQSLNWMIRAHDSQGGSIAYYPFLRLVYSLKTINLMKLEKDLIWNTNQNITVSRKAGQSSSPMIVLYLGESYVKRHSQHYGYPLSTSPFTMKEKNEGRLFVFNDAVTLKNSTSIVLRSVFSLNKSGESLWCEVPLFPVLLRNGGYKTCFFTNQFVSEHHDVWNTTGGHFLLDSRICNLLFDDRNSKSFTYDKELALLVEQEIERNAVPLFIFFQGIGQHVAFSERYPAEEAYFTKEYYAFRNELSDDEKQLVADYDNASRYVDNVMYGLMKKLQTKEAIMIYISDHGEEVLDESHKLGRQNSLDLDVVRSEYEVPMWIWCSDSYKKNHPKVVSQIQQSVDKPFVIDDISHLIIGLSALQSEYYNPERDLLNPLYHSPGSRGIGFDGFQFKGNYEEVMSGVEAAK